MLKTIFLKGEQLN